MRAKNDTRSEDLNLNFNFNGNQINVVKIKTDCKKAKCLNVHICILTNCFDRFDVKNAGENDRKKFRSSNTTLNTIMKITKEKLLHLSYPSRGL